MFVSQKKRKKKNKTALTIYFKADKIHYTFTEIVQYLKNYPAGLQS